jgi:hypothetical protein
MASSSSAQFLSDLAVFDNFQSQNCRESLGEGQFLVAPLPNCIREPEIVDIHIATAVAVGELTAEIQIDPACPVGTTVNLYKGATLTFPAGVLVLTQDVELTVGASATVTVELTTAAITDTATDATQIAPVFSVYDLCSVSSLPIAHNIGTENNKVLKDGLQGSTTKTVVSPSMNIEGFLRVTDAALWEPGGIFDSSLSDVQFYGAVLRLNGRQIYFGPMEVTSFDLSDQVETLQKYSATIQLQPGWRVTPEFSYIETANQPAINRIRNLFQLPTLA